MEIEVKLIMKHYISDDKLRESIKLCGRTLDDIVRCEEFWILSGLGDNEEVEIVDLKEKLEPIYNKIKNEKE